MVMISRKIRFVKKIVIRAPPLMRPECSQLGTLGASHLAAKPPTVHVPGAFSRTKHVFL